ncbi:MAG: hypothetical protein ACTTIQ_04560 [Peptostreptococcus stomatis]
MSFEFEGLDDLINRVDTIEKKIPEEFNRLKTKIASEVLRDVIENTPVNKDPRAMTAGTLEEVGRSEIWATLLKSTMMPNLKVSFMPGMLSMVIGQGPVWVFQSLKSDVRLCEVMGVKYYLCLANSCLETQ